MSSYFDTVPAKSTFQSQLPLKKYSVFNVVSGYEENMCVQLTGKNAGGNYEVDLDPLLSFSNMGRETNMATPMSEFLQISVSTSPKFNSVELKCLAYLQ